MNIQLSQLILIAVIIVFLVYVFRIRTMLTDRVIYSILVMGGLLFVLFPDLSTSIANLVGVGRGTDMLLYMFVIFSLFYNASMLSRVKNIEKRITLLVRELAIANAQRGILPQINPQKQNSSIIYDDQGL